MKYRVLRHPDIISFPNWWNIQSKTIFGKWKYNSGPFDTEKLAADFILNGIKKGQKLMIGETAHCVYCLNELDKRSGIGCGSVIKNNYGIVICKWCDNICLRNMYFKDAHWRGRSWLPEYGLNKPAYEPFYTK